MTEMEIKKATLAPGVEEAKGQGNTNKYDKVRKAIMDCKELYPGEKRRLLEIVDFLERHPEWRSPRGGHWVLASRCIPFANAKTYSIVISRGLWHVDEFRELLRERKRGD